MANPAWLFSTLAQASAAIAGLTIAFTISTHTMRRQHVLSRSESFEGEFSRFYNKYSGVVDTMSRTLKENAQFSYNHSVRFDPDESDIDDWARNQPDTEAAKAWATISSVGNMLSNMNPGIESNVDRDRIGYLNKASRELRPFFDPNHPSSKRIYEEITGNSAQASFHVEDIFPEKGRVQAWLNRNTTSRHDHQAGVPPGSDSYSGQDIFSWATVADEMGRDATSLASAMIGTEYTSFLNPRTLPNALLIVTKLLAVGVLIPLLLMVNPPTIVFEVSQSIAGGLAVPIANWGTVFLQVGTVLGTTWYTLQLFLLMAEDAGYELPTTFGDVLGSSDDTSPGDADSGAVPPDDDAGSSTGMEETNDDRSTEKMDDVE